METVELPGYLMKELDWLKDTTYTNNITLCHLDAKIAVHLTFRAFRYNKGMEVGNRSAMVSCYGRRQRVKNWILLKWRAGKNTSASRPVILLVFVCSNGNRFFWSILCYFCSSVLLLTWPLRGQHSFWKWLNVASDRIATTSPQKNTSNQNCWFLVNLWRISFFLGNDFFFLGGESKNGRPSSFQRWWFWLGRGSKISRKIGVWGALGETLPTFAKALRSVTDVLGKVEWKCIAGDCLQISKGCQLEDSRSTRVFQGPDLGIVSLGGWEGVEGWI